MKTIHKVCTMMRDWQAAYANLAKRRMCEECPATKTIGAHKNCTPMCRSAAQEMINIVKFGNPWGKKYQRTRKSWPDRSKFTDRK